MGKKVSGFKDGNKSKRYLFHCEGCNSTHGVYVEGEGKQNWGFNDDEEKPTFTPSVLVRWVSIPDNPEKDDKGEYLLGRNGRIKGAKAEVCHSFITDGKIRYLNDCTHHLKGQTVELLDF